MQNVKVTKDIYYRCGCKVSLNSYTPNNGAPSACVTHHEPVKKIVTTEEALEIFDLGNGVTIIC